MTNLATVLLDVSIKNDTLVTVALVLFIVCAIVWLVGWGWSHRHG